MVRKREWRDRRSAHRRLFGRDQGGREKGDKLAEVFNNRGVAYRLKGDHERAIADYGQAIKLNAKFAAAYNNRGVAYDAQRRLRPRHCGLRAGAEAQAVG